MDYVKSFKERRNKVEKIEIRLNNFLFNSGILGFYNILEQAGKKDKIEYQQNRLIVEKDVFDHFEEDYCAEMIRQYEEDTKWYTIKKRQSEVENYQLDNPEEQEKFDKFFSFLKTAVESASYKSGYEILKEQGITENPYLYLEQAKKEKEREEKRKLALKIIEHIKQYKEVYCMKDIIYTKINLFWENVAFLNRNSNKKDIKKEYKLTFVDPVISYLNTQKKSEYRCIECGNIVNKSEAFGMSWLKDVGVDINRKQSGFWNFNPDTFLCPICNLIYSCIPLGFTMMGSNGIFVNNNESIEILMEQNSNIKRKIETEKDNFNTIYQKIFYNILNRVQQQYNQIAKKQEPTNIQVIKRISLAKDEIKYQFNTISKDKLETFETVAKNFEKLLPVRLKSGESVYAEVLENFLENKKQYNLLNKILTDESENKNCVSHILEIQIKSIGGKRMQELEQYKGDLIEAGETLQKYFYVNKENENKLKSYQMRLGNALRCNSIENFMEQVTNFYLGLGQPIPAGEAFSMMLKKNEYFRVLGYSYLFGLEKKVEGGKKNEE